MENNTVDTKLMRLMAFLFDITFIVLLAFTVYMLFGLVVRIDYEGFQNLIFPPVLIMITGYLFFGELAFKNTLGKYIVGIEVKDSERSGNPSTVSLLKRGILKVIFPVEGFVLILAKNNKRLGDIWAKTLVVRKETNRLKPFFRVVIGIVLLTSLLFSFRVSMGLAVKKTDFYKAGINYLSSTGDVKITGMVKVVNQTRNSVDFIVPVSTSNKDSYAIIWLDKNGNDWRVARIAFSQEHMIGFSYGFDFSSAGQ